MHVHLLVEPLDLGNLYIVESFDPEIQWVNC